MFRLGHEVKTDALALCQELEAFLNSLYDSNQTHGLKEAELFAPDVYFVVLYDPAQYPATKEAIGCGGFRSGEFAELKRMFVRPKYRSQSYAQLILKHLEEQCAEREIPTMYLETGSRQQAAQAAYQRYGFEPCEMFGKYKEMPPENVKVSLFYKKEVRKIESAK
jgi:putative acetyltransferase